MGGMAVPSAKAADLGGDCCADLEERVAELEATTARKGNRKMSLTVYGHVNRSIMYFNDGRRSNTFIGLDNHNSASRFGFAGNAKISPTLSAGYSILLDWGDKGRTSGASQTNEEGGARSNPNVDTRNGDGIARLRDVNVWLESKPIGRLTLGRITNSGQNGLIDLGGTSPGVGSDPACTGGALGFRNAAGALSGATIANLSFGCGGPIGIRMEGLKYTSPAFMGFIFDASIGESLKVETSTVDNPSGQLTNLGRVMGANLKYAGEFSGVRVAAGIGAEWSKANEDDSTGHVGIDVVVPVGGPLGIKPTNASSDNFYWAAALSLMHVPSGLFVQGHYTKLDVGVQNPLTGAFAADKDATRWDIQAGISKNWFGFGNTVLYGEYSKHKDFRFANAQFTCTASALNAAGAEICTAVAAPTTASGDELKMMGIGLVQNIDAAAMELYLSWRHFEAKNSGGVALEDLDVVIGGARVKF
jgi:Gram-negative porin